MTTQLIVLPLILLFISFLLGYAQVSRAIVFLTCWVSLCLFVCIVLLVYDHFEHFSFEKVLFILLFIAILSLPSFWLATLFSLATSPEVSPPPIQKVCDAYQALDSEEKEMVQSFAKIGLRFAIKQGSVHLRNKGCQASSEALDEINKIIK